MASRTLMFCALAALLSLALLASPASALSVSVRAKSEHCFGEAVMKSEKVVGSWVVTEGGKLDIDVRVIGPDGKVVFERERATDGSFVFKAQQGGEHKLCMDNRMSSLSAKVVNFDLFVGAALHRRDAASAAALTPLETAVVSTSEGVHAISKAIRYAKSREERHSKTVQSTNGRVLACALVNIVAIVVVAAAQIFGIKGMFEKKRKY